VNYKHKEFNKSVAGFSPDMVVSKDLPFAQKRFCVNYKNNNLVVLSDYKYSSFGINYGLLIKELNLLARAVMILDRNNVVRYVQIGEELAKQLDYVGALKHLNEIIKTKLLFRNKDLPIKCGSCEAGTPTMPIEAIKKHLCSFPDWQLVENKKTVK